MDLTQRGALHRALQGKLGREAWPRLGEAAPSVCPRVLRSSPAESSPGWGPWSLARSHCHRIPSPPAGAVTRPSSHLPCCKGCRCSSCRPRHQRLSGQPAAGSHVFSVAMSVLSCVAMSVLSCVAMSLLSCVAMSVLSCVAFSILFFLQLCNSFLFQYLC